MRYAVHMTPAERTEIERRVADAEAIDAKGRLRELEAVVN